MTDPQFIVKVCGVTCEEDAAAAIEAGANALGFNFYRQSPRYIAPERARQIADNVPGDYLKVGVFVNATGEDQLRVKQIAGLDVLQLHGENVELPVAFRLWRSAVGADTPVHDHRIEAYVLDTPSCVYGGSGRTFDWSQAAEFPYRAIVAGGLDSDNVAAAIAALQPWGVDACSRLESSPGRKDARRVRAFVAAALEAAHCIGSKKVSAL